VEEHRGAAVGRGLDVPCGLDPALAQLLEHGRQRLVDSQRQMVEAWPAAVEEALDRIAIAGWHDQLDAAARPETSYCDAAPHLCQRGLPAERLDQRLARRGRDGDPHVVDLEHLERSHQTEVDARW
jgi:hypothetical protein